MIRRRLLIEWLIVSIVSIAAVTWIVARDALPRVNNLAYDRLLALAAQVEDTSTFAGRWPHPPTAFTSALP